MVAEKKYRELFDLKNKLHKIMKELIIKTNLGCIEESGCGGEWIEELSLDFAGGEIYSCIYYEQVGFYDREEHELDEDLDLIKKIVNELEKRLEEINENLDKTKFSKILNRSFDLNFKTS